MKLLTILGAILGAIVGYLFMAAIIWDLDPGNWIPPFRTYALFMMGAFAILGVVLIKPKSTE